MKDTSEALKAEHRPLHTFNMVLVTICVLSLVFATVTLIVWIWHDKLGDSMGRLLASIGLVLVSSLLGLTINSISGRFLDAILAKICWVASWVCILAGTIVGCYAIWSHTDQEEILLKTLGTIIVLFVSSTIGAALAGAFAASTTRS